MLDQLNIGDESSVEYVANEILKIVGTSFDLPHKSVIALTMALGRVIQQYDVKGTEDPEAAFYNGVMFGSICNTRKAIEETTRFKMQQFPNSAAEEIKSGSA